MLGLENILGYRQKTLGSREHLPIWNNIPFFEEFVMLAYCHNQYILEVKEGSLIKRYRLALNENITSAKLFNFDNN